MKFLPLKVFWRGIHIWACWIQYLPNIELSLFRSLKPAYIISPEIMISNVRWSTAHGGNIIQHLIMAAWACRSTGQELDDKYMNGHSYKLLEESFGMLLGKYCTRTDNPSIWQGLMECLLYAGDASLRSRTIMICIALRRHISVVAEVAMFLPHDFLLIFIIQDSRLMFSRDL